MTSWDPSSYNLGDPDHLGRLLSFQMLQMSSADAFGDASGILFFLEIFLPSPGFFYDSSMTLPRFFYDSLGFVQILWRFFGILGRFFEICQDSLEILRDSSMIFQ